MYRNVFCYLHKCTQNISTAAKNNSKRKEFKNHLECSLNKAKFFHFSGQNVLYFGLGFLCLSLTAILKNFKKNAFMPSVEASDVPDEIFLASYRNSFNFIADVVEKTASSVVYIAVIDSRRNDIFTGQPIVRSVGSGFIVRSDGLILTNAHVVAPQRNTDVVVKLTDGSTYKATVQKVDVRTDLAAIKITPSKRLNVMKLGSVNDLRPGEWVVAIGSPMSLSNTATCGVVSTVERTAPELGLKDDTMYYIQTDAAITFGNSGGPLVNLDCEAIGINSMKVTTGISFAVPINYARDFLKNTSNLSSTSASSSQVLKKYMGITILSLNVDIIKELQLHDNRIPLDVSFGVLVWKVTEGSPADLGGLRPGDILTHVNGVPILRAETLYRLLENPSIHTLNIFVVRRDKHLQLSVKPEDINL